jgi:hypothetical protein
LRVEETTAKKEKTGGNQESEIEELVDLKKLQENDLSWLFESLRPIRYLVHYKPQCKTITNG